MALGLLCFPLFDRGTIAIMKIAWIGMTSYGTRIVCLTDTGEHVGVTYLPKDNATMFDLTFLRSYGWTLQAENIVLNVQNSNGDILDGATFLKRSH